MGFSQGPADTNTEHQPSCSLLIPPDCSPDAGRPALALIKRRCQLDEVAPSPGLNREGKLTPPRLGYHHQLAGAANPEPSFKLHATGCCSHLQSGRDDVFVGVFISISASLPSERCFSCY